jgi:hypothetical protein
VIVGGAAVDARRFAAVSFDLDGGITDTASVHADAWKALFDRELRRAPTARAPGRRRSRRASAERSWELAWWDGHVQATSTAAIPMAMRSRAPRVVRIVRLNNLGPDLVARAASPHRPRPTGSRFG